ncbi:MAG: D-alanine--D-alanine ligase family protein [Bacteroidota bacterium]
MKNKIRVGVVFGGRSVEHEVSLVSASSIINALDREKYDIIPIGITKEGRWLSSAETIHLLKSGDTLDREPERILLPDPTKRTLMQVNPESFRVNADSVSGDRGPLDVIIPVLHGTYGEDGTIQGLFELANIPYVGAGVLSSAAGMDKVVAKQLFECAGLPVTKDVWFLWDRYRSDSNPILTAIEKKLGYPCFVKPANLGSSVGISKARNARELVAGIEQAANFERKILVEQGIENAREIECSVLGNDDPRASIPGEIIPSNEFYDYDAKYVDGKSTALIPAKLPRRLVRKIQDYAVAAFRAIDCAGMARVDFLVQKKTNKTYVNEINTIPGFTSISMYPKLWEASGIPFPKLLDILIDLALERHEGKRRLKITYKPKADWFKS